jgi:hypothetical protein
MNLGQIATIGETSELRKSLWKKRVFTVTLLSGFDESLVDKLAKIPFLKIISIGRERNGVDFVVNIALKNKKQALIVELKNNGQPRVAREAVNQRGENVMPGEGIVVLPSREHGTWPVARRVSG